MVDYIDAVPAGAAVTGNTTNVGVVTVADTTPFYAGAEAWMSGTALTPTHVMITKILSATTMQVRPLNLDTGSNVNYLSYGVGGDLSAFTLAAGSRIDMPRQVVRVEYSFSKRSSI